METPELNALVERSPATAESSGATAWKLCLSVLSLSLGALFLVYFDTYRSMAQTWSRSDTYVHGYFVLPISLYLVWTLRHELQKLTPRPDARAIVPIAVAGIGFVAARLGGVLVAEQYFAVATIPLMVWAVAGSAVAHRILFPLAYLLLLVPVGEALIPHLIDSTAAFTVAALRASGVPVLQEGNLLTLPASQWSVVEACSGIRYLIACVTIGLLFAYLTYRSWTRRALFIGLSVVVPIVANWVRAYLIVLIGHASDMRLAVGVDHLIYGWIFYAIVMCLLLWVGALFSDDRGEERREVSPARLEETRPFPIFRTVVVACAGVLAAAFWQVWAAYAESRLPQSAAPAAFAFPERVGDWTSDAGRFLWEPHYVGAAFSRSAMYRSSDSAVGLHVALYPEVRQGAELVSSANSLIAPETGGWRQVGRGSRELLLRGRELEVEEAILSGRGGALLVYRWYSISGHETSSPVRAKVLESTEKLRLRRPFAAGVVLFTDGDDDEARARLEEFLADGLPSIESALEASSR